MHIEGFEPIAENPVFTVDIPSPGARRLPGERPRQQRQRHLGGIDK
jgi:hypothetical protein